MYYYNASARGNTTIVYFHIDKFNNVQSVLLDLSFLYSL